MDQDYLHALKKHELESVVAAFGDCFEGKDLLEIGSGTGYQLSLLAERCKSVTGIDLPSSTYAGNRVAKVTDYDGIHIPFDDHSFDIIFSSNSLEHIHDINAFHQEMHRVLKNDGIAIHIVPTHLWKLWTILAHYPALPRTIIRKLMRKTPKAESFQATASIAENQPCRRISLRNVIAAVSFPPRHGEKGNAVSEIIHLLPGRWAQEFTANAWTVVDSAPTGLFHSGYCLFGLGIPVQGRKALARVLGSACRTFILSKKPDITA